MHLLEAYGRFIRHQRCYSTLFDNKKNGLLTVFFLCQKAGDDVGQQVS